MTLCSYAFSHCSAPGTPLGQAVRVEVRLFQVHSFRRSCFSRWLGKEGFVRFVVAITPLSHGPNCRCLSVPQSRCTHWTSSENRRIYQVPSCLLLSHSFSEHASAHVVSATSPPFEWYFPIRPNCVQVQQGGGVHNHPSNGLRFWWYLHLTVELKLILECPDHATHQSHCSLGQTISSMITWRRCFQGGYGSCSSCVSHCSGNLHHSRLSIAAYGHL